MRFSSFSIFLIIFHEKKLILEKICRHLTSQNIDFKCTLHPPTLTSEESAKTRGDKLEEGAKAILYKIQDTFKIFVIAADRQIDPKKIKSFFKAQGMRVKKTRFATKEELFELTTLVPGSLPPFGKPIFELDLYLDPSLSKNEFISFNAGSLTDSIRMSFKDYLAFANATQFDFAKGEN